jgi:mRNA interferase HicA
MSRGRFHFDNRTYLCESDRVNGHEFERKIKKIGRDRDVAVSFDSGRGKGSHGRLYYGDRFTTLKDRRKEIGPGLLKAMLDQLGLTRGDLEKY